MSLFGTFAELRHASSVRTLYSQGPRRPYWKDLQVCNNDGVTWVPFRLGGPLG